MMRSSKNRCGSRPWVLAVSGLLALCGVAGAGPVGSAFTYQGQLNVSGAPATGSYDIRFGVFGAASGGMQMYTAEHTGVAVQNGIFTRQLDFGEFAFNGAERWIEISIRPAGSGQAYTTLSPRQQVTAVPYALGLAAGAFTTAATETPLLTMHQEGTGNGVILGMYHPSNDNTTLTALTQGTGFAATFGALNETSTSPAMWTVTTGMGNAAKFQAMNSTSTAPAVYSVHQGNGNAGNFELSNSSSNASALVAKQSGAGPALDASTSGSGRAVSARTIGSGYAVYGYAQSNANAVAGYFAHGAGGKALWAHTGSNGTAFEASASNGTAVLANGGWGTGVRASTSGGIALQAQAGTNGTALQIDSGAIRVNGAGINTSTAVFRHRVTSSTITGCIGTACRQSVINHPMCNNNPNAMLVVTEVITNTDSFYRTAPIGVFYKASSGRWHIQAQGNLSQTDPIEELDEGQEFNVMVVVP
jgi:hypothetical protein